MSKECRGNKHDEDATRWGRAQKSLYSIVEVEWFCHAQIVAITVELMFLARFWQLHSVNKLRFIGIEM